MGSYSFFNQGVNIFAVNAFEVPATLPPASLNDLLTNFLTVRRDPAASRTWSTAQEGRRRSPSRMFRSLS